jgi:uncharacterized protein (TIGR03437 family)
MRLFWFLVAAPLFGQYLPNAQFSNLVTTRDGKVLYFSSPLSLRGDNEFVYQKIFRIDPAGIHLAAELDRSETFGGPNYTTFYLAIEPDISGDGAVFSYVARRTCQGGSSCVFVELYQSRIPGRIPELFYSGRTRLSRDGRYALRYGATGFALPSDPVPALIDLSTGASTPVPGRIPEGRQVARGGTVLAFAGSSWVLWSKAGSQPLTLPGSINRAVLSDDAGAIAVETADSLVLYDVASGAQIVVDRSSAGFDASLSDDGRLVCYVRGDTVVLYDRTTGTSRPLLAAPDGIREAVISGNGSTVWAATIGGRILRVDVASGGVQQVIARTPLITEIVGAPVSGSFNWARGSGLSDGSTAAVTPLPEFLGGESLLIGSTSARMNSVNPNEIQYQIPFEMPPGTYGVSLTPNDSPFEQPSETIDVVPYAPQPLALGADTIIAHADFSALVNAQSPARLSEVIHVYFTGLGPVSPPLASGMAAPLDRLSAAMQNPYCQSSPPSEILFAGMAPGLVGIYQVDIRLPPQVIQTNNGRGFVLFDCGDGGVGFYAFSVPVDLSHE